MKTPWLDGRLLLIELVIIEILYKVIDHVKNLGQGLFHLFATLANHHIEFYTGMQSRIR